MWKRVFFSEIFPSLIMGSIQFFRFPSKPTNLLCIFRICLKALLHTKKKREAVAHQCSSIHFAFPTDYPILFELRNYRIRNQYRIRNYRIKNHLTQIYAREGCTLEQCSQNYPSRASNIDNRIIERHSLKSDLDEEGFCVDHLIFKVF